MRPWPRALSFVALSSVSLALAACGGSDGPPAYDIAIAYSRSPLTSHTWDDLANQGVCVSATLSPEPDVFPTVRVLDDGATFSLGTVWTVRQADGSYQACLQFRPGLAAGEHTGTLTLQLCKEASCSQQYKLSQPTLPYSITVYHVVAGLPPLTAQILVDGAVPASVTEGLSGSTPTYAISVRSGQIVRVAIDAQCVEGRLSPTFVTTSVTAKSWSVRAQLGAGATSGSGSLEIRAVDGRRVQVTAAIAP